MVRIMATNKDIARKQLQRKTRNQSSLPMKWWCTSRNS